VGLVRLEMPDSRDSLVPRVQPVLKETLVLSVSLDLSAVRGRAVSRVLMASLVEREILDRLASQATLDLLVKRDFQDSGEVLDLPETLVAPEVLARLDSQVQYSLDDRREFLF